MSVLVLHLLQLCAYNTIFICESTQYARLIAGRVAVSGMCPAFLPMVESDNIQQKNILQQQRAVSSNF